MQGRRGLLLFGVVSLLIVLICAVVVAGVYGYLRRKAAAPHVIGEVTRCSEGALGVCVVSLGVDPFDRMVVALDLRGEDYPPFYLSLTDSLGTSRFECVTNSKGTDCTGRRSPLGDTIEIRLLSLRGSELLAQGSIRVQALALPTTMNMTIVPEALTPRALESHTPFARPRPANTLTPTPTPTSTFTRTPTPTGTITPPTPTRTGTVTPPTPTPTRTSTFTP